jgi:hypothetical protein
MVRYIDDRDNTGRAFMEYKEKVVIIGYSVGQVRGKGEVIGYDGIGKSFSGNTKNVEGFGKLESYLSSGWTVKEVTPVETASTEQAVIFVTLCSYKIVKVIPDIDDDKKME